jgi:alkanesulfonate monooxygenase SsuD/methylene tetrahydromethanopterin reductase-like flavin-dependent oxidoreductase (luciferase family)
MKQDMAYSIFELSVVTQGETMEQTLHNSLTMTRKAEACHYKHFWFGEHHNSDQIGIVATSILIGYMAENTKSIRLGPGGIMLPNHSPLVIAEQFCTLAHFKSLPY